MEPNRPGVMSTQRKCIRRCQGCMAAQVIFHHRCEPTQVEIAVSTGDHKGCFAVTVFRCDFLHDIIGRKCGDEAYTRRIASLLSNSFEPFCSEEGRNPGILR